MSSAIVPIPQVDVSVREATLDDFAFIDGLQKLHSKMVGFMHRATLEGKIKAREVILAEQTSADCADDADLDATSSAKSAQSADRRLGYCIGTDRYFKHDDVGIIYHLNVSPGKQRGFVGATLLRAMFERAAYGCRLFCCWCAQDIEANRFWESMGFVPLAYRAGSEKKARVHIFWQKRIRAGDTTTPWWFPSQTTGGAIREDRLVLPIPPGRHWSDEMPVILPAEENPRALPYPSGPRKAREKAPPTVTMPKRAAIGRAATLTFAPPAPPPSAKAEKPQREKKPKRKNDPNLVTAARELRDRWLEQVNAGAYVLEDAGKYDVARIVSTDETTRQRHLGATAVECDRVVPLLPAA